MVTYHKPFEDTENHRKLLKMQLSRDWHFPSDLKLADDLKELIQRMLEPDVEIRPLAMTVLRHPWVTAGYGIKS